MRPKFTLKRLAVLVLAIAAGVSQTPARANGHHYRGQVVIVPNTGIVATPLIVVQNPNVVTTQIITVPNTNPTSTDPRTSPPTGVEPPVGPPDNAPLANAPSTNAQVGSAPVFLVVPATNTAPTMTLYVVQPASASAPLQLGPGTGTTAPITILASPGVVQSQPILLLPTTRHGLFRSR